MAVLSWWSDLSVNSVNERDLSLLNSWANCFFAIRDRLLRGTFGF